MKKKNLLIITLGIFSILFANNLFAQRSPVQDKDFPKEINQFDFWVGNWKYSAKYPYQGKVYVSTGIDSCRKTAKRIMESCMSEANNKFNQNTYLMYDIVNKKWRMTIMDPAWGQYNLSGTFNGDEAVFVSDKMEGDANYYTITFFDIKKDSFKITWRNSTDNKKTWKGLWFLEYKKIDKK